MSRIAEPVRAARTSTRDVASLLLALAALVALGLLIGPVWVARAGGLVAVLAVVAAVVFARRELRRTDRQHNAEMAALTEQARVAAQRHHDETMQVIGRFSARVENLRVTVAGLEAELARARQAVAQRDADLHNAALRRESLQASNTMLNDAMSAQMGVNAQLRDRVRALESQLSQREQELQKTAAAEIVSLPRRAASSLRAELEPMTHSQVG